MKRIVLLALMASPMQGCLPDGPHGTVGAFVTAPVTAPLKFVSARMNDPEDFPEEVRQSRRPLPSIDASPKAQARTSVKQTLDRDRFGQGLHRQNDGDASVELPQHSAQPCPPAEIRVLPSYEAPQGFEYVPREELGTAPGAHDELLGVIETKVGWNVNIGIRQRCRGTRCELCIDRIEGRAGFEPGRMRVTEKFRGDRCRTNAVLAHETRHSRVFDETTQRGVRELVITLTRWAAEQTMLVATRETVEAAAKSKYDEIEGVMQKGVASMELQARARNERIDSPRAYEAEREGMERRCRESP